MTLLAHAIGPAVFPVPATDGLRGRVLRRVAVRAAGPDYTDDDLCLWATTWDGPPGPLARDDAVAHHAIVAAIAAAGPCLPVRFGSWVADETAAVDLLAGREGAFRAGLRRVAGRSELAVTLLWLDSPVIPGRGHVPAPAGAGREGEHPGRRFLEARRREHAGTAARQDTAEGFAEQLAALFVELGARPEDLRHETCPTAEVALRLSALVGTGDAGPAKEAVSRLIGGLAGVRGVVSGPWPPYSFTPELR